MKNFAKALILMSAIAVFPFIGHTQQYTGISGFLHIPSAEMNYEGDARIGAHFLHMSMTPDTGFLFRGEKYNTFDYYLSATPYRWLELSYTCTKRKIVRPMIGDIVYGAKDCYLSVKIRPLEEGKYYPAIAIGGNDLGTTVFNKDRSDVQLYFSNLYIAATKHFSFGGNELGLNLAYRHFFRGYNSKWNGFVGGISFRPAFFPQARAIVEYTGNELLVGADALLWQHVLIQASMKDFKYFNFGLCLQLNMLGKKYLY